MNKILILLFSGLLILFAASSVSAKEENAITISIFYDNYVFADGLKAEWGFSCIIEGTEQTILFDTGRDKDIFYGNIDKLSPNLDKVQQVVISHFHFDHTGNLFNFLADHNKVDVYLPASFTKPFIQKVEKTKARVVSVDKPIQICKDVFLTGEMYTKVIQEQSLIIDTSKGLVVIAGCAHPGIVNIVKKAKEIVPKNVFLVMGGFHLLNESDQDVQTIIKQLLELGVTKVGPSHCTGDRAIELFKKAYGTDFIQLGVGKVVQVRL